MVNGKRLAQLAKKWQRMTALGRKRFATAAAAKETEGSCTSMAGNGRFVVYTTDGARFEVPLAFLGTAVLGELLRMSTEEFGFAGEDGRITLPCDAAVMEYAMCLLGRNASAETEKAFLSSMAMPCHYGSCAAPSAAVGVSHHVAACSN